MIRPALIAAALAVPVLVLAKLPPPDPAAKAKADAAAAKAAWQAKVDAYQLCQVQDRIAATVKRSPPASAPVAVAAKPAASAASAPQGTPVANVAPAPTTIPPCADPGPFAYTPPTQTPIETSEAHSPPGTATKPPSVNATSAEMTPKK